MFVDKHRTALAVLVVALLVTPLTADESALSELPRYRLEVSQELVYRGGGEFRYEGGRFLTDDTWQFWVVARNPDQSWRLLIQHASRFRQVRDGAKDDAANDDAPRVEFAWCDFFPNGCCVENPSLGLKLNPSLVLPRLPTTLAETGRGWNTHDARLDETTDSRLAAGSSPDRCTISITSDSPFKAVYGTERSVVVTFDRIRGLPEKIVVSDRQTYGFNGQGTATLALTAVKRHPQDWCEQMRADSAACFDALQAYDSVRKRRELTSTELKTALDAAEDELRQIADRVRSAEVKEVLTQQLVRRHQEQKYVIEEAEERAAVLGTMSPEWSTTDLDGNDHSLKDYRGKIVVLDFWYRGCGWCIRAMPQLKELATRFQGRPVAVLGMNTDETVEDARFVVEKLGINYPTLKAAGLPEKYQVSTFPTLLVLDQHGIIRDVHVGYSPTLANDVAKSIEGLLRNRP